MVFLVPDDSTLKMRLFDCSLTGFPWIELNPSANFDARGMNSVERTWASSRLEKLD